MYQRFSGRLFYLDAKLKGSYHKAVEGAPRRAHFPFSAAWYCKVCRNSVGLCRQCDSLSAPGEHSGPQHTATISYRPGEPAALIRPPACPITAPQNRTRHIEIVLLAGTWCVMPRPGQEQAICSMAAVALVW